MGMGSPNDNGNERERRLDRGIERYREAANSAPGQLEWIVDYLYKIRKAEIAKALGRDRRQIIKNIQ
jgi:hypothetical protein